MRCLVTRILAILVLCGAAATAFAQGAPSTVSFVARLSDGGQPVSGSHDFVFAIYDAPTGGTQLWSEARNGLTVPQDGLLYLDLGSVTPLTSAILNGSPRYLEITLDGTVSDPRVLIESVPYALSAGLASHASDADALAGHDPSYFQRAVGMPCAMGSYVQGIAADGSLTCVPDQNTMYTAGTGLLLAGTTFSIDPATTQARVTGFCMTGAIQAVNGDGSVTCLAPGTGLTYDIAATAFDVDFTQVQARVQACPASGMLNAVAQDGSATCITAGSGLSVAANTMTVNTSTIQARVTGTCTTGAINAIAANGSVTCTSATTTASPAGGVVSTSENTTSTSYTDLATVGPTATVDITSGAAIVTVTANIQPNGGGAVGYMSFTGGGVAASDSRALYATFGGSQQSATFYVTGLTNGSQTFTAQYRHQNGTSATFTNRNIVVIPVP